MRGVERRVQRDIAGESWFARVQCDDGSTIELARTDYESQGVEPGFWSLPRERTSHATAVAQGLTRVGEDFSDLVTPLGFNKVGKLRWARTRGDHREEISIERSGSSYGAPHSSSVDLRLWLSKRAIGPSGSNDLSLRCDKVRKADGRAYHHRFNAETYSTYDLCLEDLALFVNQFALSWFDNPDVAAAATM